MKEEDAVADSFSLTVPRLLDGETWFRVGTQVADKDWYQRMQAFLGRGFGKTEVAHPKSRVFRVYKILPPKDEMLANEYFKHHVTFPYIHKDCEFEWTHSCEKHVIALSLIHI